MKKLYLIPLLSLLVLTACNQTVDTNTNANINTNTNTPPVETATTTPSVTTKDTLVPYENKAVGYTLMRPRTWQWRHLIKSQIQATDTTNDDLFITDPVKLGAVGSDNLGQIVLAVSSKSLSDYQDTVKDLTAADTKVAEIDGKRYDGMRNDQRVIEYQFTRNGKTFRFTYMGKQNDEVTESMFEDVVKSLKFN